jgi:hypothetical protein
MTPEGKVKARVKKLLAPYLNFGLWYYMPVQNGMGTPVLDFIGCYKGQFFAIETKAPGGKPTKRQELTMTQMRQAGAAVMVIDSEESANRQLSTFLSAP